MQRTWAGRVELDQCPKCHSLFFDAGELESTLGIPIDAQPTEHKARHACPVCIKAMAVVTLAGARASSCPACRGVWLEKSQVEALRKYLRGETPPPNSAPIHAQSQTFACVNCKVTHPMVNARKVGGALLCPACEGGFASAGSTMFSPLPGLGDLLEVMMMAVLGGRHRHWRGRWWND